MKTISPKCGVLPALYGPNRPDAPVSLNQLICFHYPSLAGHEVRNHLRAMQIGHGATRIEVMQAAPLERRGSRIWVDRNDDLAVRAKELCILSQQIKRISRTIKDFVEHDAIPAAIACVKICRLSNGNVIPPVHRFGRRFNAKGEKISQHCHATSLRSKHSYQLGRNR